MVLDLFFEGNTKLDGTLVVATTDCMVIANDETVFARVTLMFDTFVGMDQQFFHPEAVCGSAGKIFAIPSMKQVFIVLF